MGTEAEISTPRRDLANETKKTAAALFPGGQLDPTFFFTSIEFTSLYSRFGGKVRNGFFSVIHHIAKLASLLMKSQSQISDYLV
jgi:hypothetical protein